MNCIFSDGMHISQLCGHASATASYMNTTMTYNDALVEMIQHNEVQTAT